MHSKVKAHLFVKHLLTKETLLKNNSLTAVSLFFMHQMTFHEISSE